MSDNHDYVPSYDEDGNLRHYATAAPDFESVSAQSLNNAKLARDGSEIQPVINEAENEGGGTVVLNPGTTYEIDTPIAFDVATGARLGKESNVTLMSPAGFGASGATIQPSSSFTGNTLIDVSGTSHDDRAGARTSFQGIEVTAPNSTVKLFNLEYTDQLRFQNCLFGFTGAQQIYAKNVWDVWLYGNRFMQAGDASNDRHMIEYIDASGPAICNTWRYFGNRFEANNGAMQYWRNPATSEKHRGFYYYGNKFHGWPNQADRPAVSNFDGDTPALNEVVLLGNYFTNTAQHHLNLQGVWPESRFFFNTFLNYESAAVNAAINYCYFGFNNYALADGASYHFDASGAYGSVYLLAENGDSSYGSAFVNDPNSHIQAATSTTFEN